MRYSGENPAAPKGRGRKKKSKMYTFFEFHYSKRTRSSINFFPKWNSFLLKVWYADSPDAITWELLPQGFQSGAAFSCSHSFKDHFKHAMLFFSICSCPLLVKAKTPLSDIHSGGHSTQFTGTSRLVKFLPALISGCLQTQAQTSLISYSWGVISFPRPQEIETD